MTSRLLLALHSSRHRAAKLSWKVTRWRLAVSDWSPSADSACASVSFAVRISRRTSAYNLSHSSPRTRSPRSADAVPARRPLWLQTPSCVAGKVFRTSRSIPCSSTVDDAGNEWTAACARRQRASDWRTRVPLTWRWEWMSATSKTWCRYEQCSFDAVRWNNSHRQNSIGVTESVADLEYNWEGFTSDDQVKIQNLTKCNWNRAC